MERIRAEQITTTELVTARESITRSLPGLFETTSQAASSIGELFVHALPLDHYRTLPARVDAVSTSDVRRVAREFLRLDELVVVAVGDRARIERGLEGLGLGPLEQAGPDGQSLEQGSGG